MKIKMISTDDFRIRALMVTLMLTLFLCAMIAGVYLYLETYAALALIAVVTPLYLAVFLMLKKGKSLLARVWFLSVLMAQLTIATLLFSSLSGFHYYFFIIPAVAGLFFNVEDVWQRRWAMLFFLGAIACFLFFNYSEPAPRVAVSEAWFKILSISSSIMSMLTLFVGFSFIAFEIMQSKKELIRLATSDPLTGIINRREFFVRGQLEIDRSDRYNQPVSLLMLDLDYFKRVNDTFGHAKGDTVLKRFADTCIAEIRSSDIFARLGGEEFALLLPQSDTERARVLAERLRAEIERLAIPSDTGPIHVTVSIGISTGSRPGISLSRMMQAADTALYRAKKQGRNRVVTG